MWVGSRSNYEGGFRNVIPKITQKAPDVLWQYWCGTCNASLLNPSLNRGVGWRFCPHCGEPIEYDKAKPVQWSEQNCERCGCVLIKEVQNAPTPYFVTCGNYIGAPICSSCMEEHCVQTNCFQCEMGCQPDCPYSWIKKDALKRDENV